MMPCKKDMRLIGLFATICISATILCACSTFVIFKGGCQPENVARIETWFRYYMFVGYDGWIDSIDGAQPHGLLARRTNAAEVCPGYHWLQLRDERHIGLGGGIRICALDLDVEGGHTYKFLAHTLDSAAPRIGKMTDDIYSGSISAGITAPDGATRIKEIPVTCTHGLSQFCKRDSDCSPSTAICITNDKYPIGLCRKTNDQSGK